MASANEIWLNNLEEIMQNGINSSPRNLKIIECLCFKSVIPMAYPIVSVISRRLSFRFMLAEALWILEGNNKVEPLARYAPSIRQFSDDGKTFYGAYGPQISPQLDYVVNKLVEDTDTRQAVATIWIRCPTPSKDIPCTVSVQWIVRNNVLHCIDTMRSSDLWLGWPYDVFSFTILTALVGLKLKERGVTTKLGNLFLQAGSQHLYERDFKKANNCLKKRNSIEYPPLCLSNFQSSTELFDNLKKTLEGNLSEDDWLFELFNKA